MTVTAAKVSIVVEKLIQEGVAKIVEAAGARGYTLLEGGGKGGHAFHSTERRGLVGEFAIVKFEVIVADRAVAEAIAEKVAATYFGAHSGIVYLEDVEVLRADKFSRGAPPI